MKLAALLRLHAALLCAALLLVGCEGSTLVSIDAPPSVSPQQTFDVNVVQTWETEFEFPPPNDDESATLVFVLALPDTWIVSDIVDYVGTLGGNDFQLTLQRQPGPIPDNARDTFFDGAPDDILDQYDDVSCSTVPTPPAGTQFVYYMASDPFPASQVVLTPDADGGVFTVEVQSGLQNGTYEVIAAHGLYTVGLVGGGQNDDPVTFCGMFGPESDNGSGFPEEVTTVTASIVQAGVAPPPPADDAVAVPVGGAWLALLMALGLIGSGLWFGWRKDQAPNA